MKIKLLKPIIVFGCPGVQVGEVFDCPPGVASYLISDGAAEVAPTKAYAEIIQTREPEVETREPIAETLPDKPLRRRAAK